MRSKICAEDKMPGVGVAVGAGVGVAEGAGVGVAVEGASVAVAVKDGVAAGIGRSTCAPLHAVTAKLKHTTISIRQIRFGGRVPDA